MLTQHLFVCEGVAASRHHVPEPRTTTGTAVAPSCDEFSAGAGCEHDSAASTASPARPDVTGHDGPHRGAMDALSGTVVGGESKGTEGVCGESAATGTSPQPQVR